MEEGRELSEEDEQMVEVNGAHDPSPSQNGHLVEERVLALVKNDEADFGAWTSIISEIENTSPNDIESICKVYDAFLSKFPLCYGYWKKYVSHMAYHCNLNEVQKVYEKAVEAVSYSVDLWVSYCVFGVLAYEDPDDVRRLFERGLSFVGKDYLSHLLWDKYIEFECSQKQWSHLAYIYISTLRFPTKKLNDYYMRFKKLVAIWEEEMGCEKNTTVENGSCENTDEKACKPAESMSVIRNLLNLQDGLPKPSAVKKYFSTGELLYHMSSQLDEKVNSYEARIQRLYFDVKPLDDCQLENWHQYLDFVEMQGDFDWAVKLYERCLIPCANYPEFWIRYVEFVEAKGGREIANHTLGWAQKVFLKRVPAFHLYCSMFKEKTGDVNGAHALFLQPDIELDPEFIENVIRKANMEKRMGNTDSAYMVYEKAIEMAKAKENLQILSILYVKFARFTFVVSNDVNAAMDVFLRGIHEVPCKSIMQELINFLTLCGGPGQIAKLGLIVANMIAPESVISQSLNSCDCQEISSLFLEFVDLHGTIHDVRKAWDHHRKLFPHIMNPIAKSHCTPIGDDPLVKEVVGRIQMFVPGLPQARGNNGHDGSRTHLLVCQPPEGNGIPSDGKVGNSQDDINDNNGKVKLIEVAEDIEKHYVNDDKGREALVEVAEDVDKQLLNDNKGKEEPVEVAEDVEMQSIPEGLLELHEEAKPTAPECQDAAHVPEAMPEYPKVETQVQSHPEQVSGDNLRPPSLEDPSHSPDNDTRQSKPSASCDHNIPQEATSGAGENILLDEVNSDEVSASRVSEPIDTKPSTPSQAQGNNSPLHSVCDSTPPESRSNPQVQTQSHAQTSPQQALPVNVAYAQTASSTGNWPQMYYVQSSQSQQWQVHPQLTAAGTTNTQMVVAQGYPYQSQAWTGTVDQQANQTFGQYPVTTAQMYPIGNLAWPGQSVQQQAYAYVQQQSDTQPQLQTQINQQSGQSNEQHGYVQNSQGIPPHILQYYQQQYYYLQQQQQQQQQSSQLQSNSQQDQKTDQLQQMNPSQQQQQPNQQILSQQLQQLPNQRRSNQQQAQQSSQQPQRHQSTQYQQQNQQVLNTQQYQQLLYMQQQQQQQLYLQQQQQYYLHQQQLLQQQQFQQLSQQEQQALLQQQQQLLHDQQQQQVFQLQQQHQLQLQQLQQQPVQHQLQQHPVQQEQLSASDQKALSSNYVQGEGDKLQNSEKSGSPISPHPQSPRN